MGWLGQSRWRGFSGTSRFEARATTSLPARLSSSVSRRPDVILACVILALGIAIGAVYRKAYDDADGVQDFPTREFGAAVAMACGHGFVNPGYELTPALDEFLTNRRERLSCSDLPAVMPALELNATQRLYRYLMMSAALAWKVTGVSWKGLYPIYAI